ncbi:MAG: hypothetical protein QXN62_04180 [Candidatus Bathyarchaeia archaeon]|nr:hypothetical protein [Candidatus Bathyarchaeota archaeon]
MKVNYVPLEYDIRTLHKEHGRRLKISLVDNPARTLKELLNKESIMVELPLAYWVKLYQ